MANDLILGVDPGITGGLSILNPSTNELFATPTHTTTHSTMVKGKKRNIREYDIVGIRDWINQYDPSQATIELVGSRPGQGVVSVFSFGKGYGILIGIICTLGIPLSYTRPQEWKKHHNLIGTEKSDSLLLAKQLWPEHADTSFRLKKHDGVAESALIAKYHSDLLNE